MDNISALLPSTRPWQDAGPSQAGLSFADMLREVTQSQDAAGIQLVNTPPKPPVPSQFTPSGMELDGKAQKDLAKRGWTPEQIDQAVKSGTRIDAIVKETGAPATRYVNPDTGKSVVIENGTNRVIQLSEPDFKWGPGSGDVPGATMRPAPGMELPESPVVPEPLAPPLLPEEPILPDILFPG